MSPVVSALMLGLCVIAGTAGTALRVLDRLKIGCGRLERLVWAWALGLAGMGYLVLAIGSAGWLKKEVFIPILIALLAVGSRRFFTHLQGLGISLRDAWSTVGWFKKILILPVFAVLFFSLAAALSPAIGQDELCYHLTQPQNFVREHAVYAVPYSINSLWPYLTHMLFTLGILLQGAESAKLFHWIFYVLTALAVGSFTRRFINGRAAWIAAVCYLVTPAAMTQAGFAYIDHALALYVFLAFYAAVVWAQTQSYGWAWLAGVASGLAASVKLVGLFAVFPVAVLAAAACLNPDARKRGLAGIWRMSVGMAAAGAVWYVRSWILRGNPVYPFFPALFGGHGFNDPTYVDVHARGAGIGAFLLLPWDMTFHPDLFGGEVMGPLFLACAPLAFIWERGTAVYAAAAALAVYAAAWFKIDPNIRFFFSAFAWMAVMAGAAVDAWAHQASGLRRIVLRGSFLAFVLFQAAFAPYHFSDEARLLIGGNRQAYLHERERSSSVAEEVNRFLRPDDWILSAGEIRGFYFRPRFTLAGDFERMTPISDLPRDPEALARYLKTFGFTHILASDLRVGAGELSKIEEAIADRAATRPFFKDELVVRSHGHSYVIYRII